MHDIGNQQSFACKLLAEAFEPLLPHKVGAYAGNKGQKRVSKYM